MPTYFHDEFDCLIATTRDCIEAQRIAPSLILLVSAIDILGWLNRPESKADTDRAEFQKWVKDYLLPESGLPCNEVDIYAARCGWVHSFGFESSGTRRRKQGPTKERPPVKILYACGTGDERDLEECTALIGYPGVVTVHLKRLFKALLVGIDRFQSALSRDPRFAAIVAARVGKHFPVYLPKAKLESALTALRANAELGTGD